MPPGACDCHAHVFGPPTLYPYVAGRRYTPSGAGLDDYLATLHALGITRAVVVQPTLYADNRVTLDALGALQRAGIAARGIARLEPSASDDEIARLHHAGFRGIRCHLRGNREDRADEGGAPGARAGRLAAIEAFSARLARFGWHLQLHLDGDELPALEPWLRRLPVDVVLDHFGRVRLADGCADAGCRALLRLLAGGTCWVKMSAPYRCSDALPPYPALAPFARVLAAAAPGRLLWGSDWPHSSLTGAMPDDAALLDMLALWVPDAGARHGVLVDNPSRLYGFDL